MIAILRHLASPSPVNPTVVIPILSAAIGRGEMAMRTSLVASTPKTAGLALERSVEALIVADGRECGRAGRQRDLRPRIAMLLRREGIRREGAAHRRQCRRCRGR
jgi:hypothetical protein